MNVSLFKETAFMISMLINVDLVYFVFSFPSVSIFKQNIFFVKTEMYIHSKEQEWCTLEKIRA